MWIIIFFLVQKSRLESETLIAGFVCLSRFKNATVRQMSLYTFLMYRIRIHSYGNQINTVEGMVTLPTILRRSESAFHCTAAVGACCFVVTTFMVCLFFSLLPLRLYGMGGGGGIRGFFFPNSSVGA